MKLVEMKLKQMGVCWMILSQKIEGFGRNWKILVDTRRCWNILDDNRRYWKILEYIERD